MAYNTKPNKIIEILRNGGCALGVQSYLPYPAIMDVYGYAKYDYVMVDMEHTRVDLSAMENLVRACECSDMTTIFRVGSLDPAIIRACVEVGAKGVVVPHIKNGKDAADAVAFCHFNPDGVVGGGGALGMCPAVRHSNYGLDDYDEYRKWINSNFITIVLFEDMEAFENWEEILDKLTPGRDGIGFGLGDLNYSLLRKGEPDRSRELVDRYIPVISLAAKERGLFQQGMRWPFPDPIGQQKLFDETGLNMLLTFPDIAWLGSFSIEAINRARGIDKPAGQFIPGTMK